MLNRYLLPPPSRPCSCCWPRRGHAQTGSVGIGTSAPDASAALVLPTGLTTGVYVVRVGSKALRLTVE